MNEIRAYALARPVQAAPSMKATSVDFSPCATSPCEGIAIHPERDAVTSALREALGLSLRLSTVLAASEMDPLVANVGLRLARAHSLSVVDQLTDLLKQQPRR